MLRICHPNSPTALAEIAIDGSVDLDPDGARRVIELLRSLPELSGHILIRFPAIGPEWIIFNHQQEFISCSTSPTKQL